MYIARVSRTFSAAHMVKGQAGKCEQMHGHNYRVEVAVSAEKLSAPGMVADFTRLGKDLESLLPDHKLLNEVFDFNPTAENLARYFFEQMAERYPVSKVTVWENEYSCAEYSASQV